MRALVNDVVGVLRDETAGTADYRVPLREAIEAVETRSRAHATAAGIALVVKDPPDAALKARTANLAGLVLANLLANAIDASPRGASVTLDAVATKQDITFTVADVGGGLSDAVRASLFRPVASSKPGGGGMGLAISHRLARHAGGELNLLRSDATGTVFSLRVPSADA